MKIKLNKKPFEMNELTSVIFMSMMLLTACDNQKATSVEDKSPKKTVVLSALEISQKYIIADSHIDVPYRIEEKYDDVSVATITGDFDYPRAVAGGLNAPFMSIYIPSVLQKTGGSKELADKLITMVEGIVEHAPTKFAMAYSTQQLEEGSSNSMIRGRMHSERAIATRCCCPPES